MLQERRPTFHRLRFNLICQLQAEVWLIIYNDRLHNHSEYMRGRPPHEILDNH
jgi:hypothetical protein